MFFLSVHVYALTSLGKQDDNLETTFITIKKRFTVSEFLGWFQVIVGHRLPTPALPHNMNIFNCGMMTRVTEKYILLKKRRKITVALSV